MTDTPKNNPETEEGKKAPNFDEEILDAELIPEDDNKAETEETPATDAADEQEEPEDGSDQVEEEDESDNDLEDPDDEDYEYEDDEDQDEETDEETDEAAEDELAEAEEASDGEEPVAAAAPAEPKKKNFRWDSMFLMLLTCITLIRLGYLYITPLDLSAEESYFWDWSRHLDLGYHGHPPLIAWINAAAASILGVSAQAVRIPAVIFGGLGLVGVYFCGRRMFNGEVAFWAVAAWLATPLTAAIGLTMNTEALLLCFWSLALYTLWRTLDNEQPKTFWWLATMLMIALGALSSQLMLAFPALMFGYLLLSADRRHLVKKWPWLMTIGSILCILPNLWWNYQHHWAGFKVATTGSTPTLISYAKELFAQLAMLTPITWLLLIFLFFSLLLRCFRWQKQTKFLFFFSAIGLIAYLGVGYKLGVAPNWPATFYPAGMLLLAAWGCGEIGAGFLNGLRSWFPRGVKLGIALTFIAYLLPFILQLGFLPLGEKDPTAPFKGWQQLGKDVGERLQKQPRADETFILSPLRDYPAATAFYVPGNPQTYQWPDSTEAHASQYTLWTGPVDKLGWDALILHDANTPLPEDLVAAFEKIAPLGEQSIKIGAGGERKYTMWRGENLLSWPE
ncbi:4-amino-4-deoxy-L-arabinose transferase [Malonomonas rubra DSM 5091]|uniref:4-amino-4-deoxy-L-arabinose transferase n=1 Tax=Malonomonas rubra DSM 5091 TaxID=1122189 RepID=A0A1M6IL78_MALRU|nr:glycosyltransferase family 39 protein [Malonomonas rubra]SHJ35143.1 4-amino-4-deoxy-L-arabinose transferase [Malonomonas rubra DSM 5091]